jgi:hypothetical protein
MTQLPSRESAWRLRWDLWSVQALLRLALVGRDAEARPEVHLFLADRYARLAACQSRRGRRRAAARLMLKSDAHLALGGGDDGLPYAAAMGMPRPRPSVFVNAMSRRDVHGSDDAA